MDKLRILLAEDHNTVREGLKMIINSQADMEVCGEAENGQIAINAVKSLQPDLVVMDVTMPELNGLKATIKLKELYPELKILTLTRHSDDGYLKELLRAGVNGYVLKQSSSGELLQAIRAVSTGGKFLDSSIAGKIIGNFTKQPFNSKQQKTLSERETEILRQIAWGFTNKEIALQYSLSVKTVEAHKANAMRKLGFNSRIDIVRFAILQGWLQDN